MKSLAIAACCGFALSVAAGSAQAQYRGHYRDTTVPPADANATGQVSLAEYQSSRRAFVMRADTNRDGMVSRAEWDTYTAAVRHNLYLSGIKGAELIGQGPWWAMLDANKDNAVTVAEINRATAAKFAEYDVDGNYLISKVEAERVRKTAEAMLR